MIKTITAAELINGRTFDRTIIDIRPAEEYKKGSMDAALNIPEDKLVEYLENPEEADMESGTIGDGKAWEEAKGDVLKAKEGISRRSRRTSRYGYSATPEIRVFTLRSF